MKIMTIGGENSGRTCNVPGESILGTLSISLECTSLVHWSLSSVCGGCFVLGLVALSIFVRTCWISMSSRSRNKKGNVIAVMEYHVAWW